MRIPNIIYACLLVFGACNIVEAQEAKRLTLRTVERSGWRKPVFIIGVRAVKLSRAQEMEGVKVQVKKHELTEEQLVRVKGCEFKPGMSDGVNGRTFVVRDFLTYQARGRVFAYSVDYYVVSAHDGVITERYLAATRRNYVDENGDGKFEMRCGSGLMFGKLPRWIKAVKRK